MEFRLTNESELAQVVEEMLKILMKRNYEGKAFVIALHGDLGAGKTTFMQTMARALGVSETVTSPTFVVMKKYKTNHDTFKELVHIDAYRIEDIDEMRPLRFKEELEQPDTIIGIEWAEYISELLPEDTVHLYFEIDGEKRVVKVKGKR